MDRRPTKAIVDRGYRGRKWVEGTEILVPGRAPRGQTRSQRNRMVQRFRRRAAIEPVISHLKFDFRLLRCFLKGHVGDSINLLMAASAWNLRKWMREVFLCLGWIWNHGPISIHALRSKPGESKLGISTFSNSIAQTKSAANRYPWIRECVFQG